MPDAYDSLLDNFASPKKLVPTTPHLDILTSFAKENNLQVGSTTSGHHNVGSKHYTGNAIDIKGSGAFSDDQVKDLSEAAQSRGLLLRDERTHPKGQKVWGGPHVHVEYNGTGDDYDKLLDSHVNKADPYDSLLSKFDAPAQPVTQPPPITSALDKLTADVNRRTAKVQRQAYNTPLNAKEESQFQQWKRRYAPKDSGADYDLRGAYKAGLKPDAKTGHWPDTFKKPNHPTFSNESQYAVGADATKAGHWEGDKFVTPNEQPFALLKSINAQPSQPDNDAGLREQAVKNVTSFTIDPVQNVRSLIGSAAKGTQAQVDQEVENEVVNLKAQRERATTPEMTGIRKEYGQMNPAVRSVTAPLARAGGDFLKVAGGITSLAGLTPNQFSDWANKRGRIVQEGASLPPLARGLSTENTGIDEEVKRGLPEKVVSALADTGLSIAEIVLMKKATGLSMSKLLALETALKTSDQPVAKRASQVAESAALGKILEGHLSRPASAALFGLPTAAREAQAYHQGNTSLEDAILQTAIQIGVGGALGGKPEAQGETSTQVPDINKILSERESRVIPPLNPQELARRQANAVQVESAGRMDVRQQTENGEGVGARNASNQIAPQTQNEGGQGQVAPRLRESQKVVSPVSVPASEVQSPNPVTNPLETAGEGVVAPKTMPSASEQMIKPNMNDLHQYGQSVVGENKGIKSVKLIGSTAAKGEGRDIDILYDLGDVKLPKDTGEGETEQAIIDILEAHDNLRPVGEFDVFVKAGDRYFYQAKGAGVGFVENSEYGREQAAKPSIELSGVTPKSQVKIEAENPLVKKEENPSGERSINRETRQPLSREVRNEFILPKGGEVTRPMAAEGLTSYRYRPESGIQIAIGAKGDADALNEARRSLSSGKPDISRLDVWDGEKYVPVSQPSTPGVSEPTPEIKSSITEGEPPKNASVEVTNGAANSTSEGEGAGTPAREIAPEPSNLRETTSVKNAATKDLRESLDLLEIEGPEKKSFQQTIDNAVAKELDKKAESIADEVINGNRMLGDEEEAGIQIRMRELENQWEELYAKNHADPKLADIKERLGNLTKASKLSGTPIARALGFRRSNIDKEFKLINLVTQMEEAKGRTLTAKEFERYEKMAADFAELKVKYADAEERVKTASLQKEIDKVSRQRRRTETKVTLDDEFASLKAQFPQAKAELPRVQASGLASLDPEGKLTILIGKMARNRVKAGTVQAEALVDEIYSAMKEHLDGWNKRDVRDAISGYGIEPKGDRRSPEAKQLADIRGELKRLSASEDIEAGKRLSPRDKARQTQLLKQEAELQRRLGERDFSAAPQREPPKYTRETYDIQKRLNEVKAQFERDRYRATRGATGKAIDTVASVGNIPKTLLSMGDVSALLRQGGVGVYQHPILSGRAARDMLQSFTAHGFANVENAIKNHPDFDLAKRSGIEFTGIDKDDPRLSKHEEGYLGTGAIDTLAKGRFNPLRVVKGVKDFSERTFVSFLDSQRMNIFANQAEALRGMKLKPKEINDALKSQAKYINTITGRGNLGVKGNQAAPLLNMAMFSPRLLASRVQLLNRMLNPVSWANKPKGARKLQMIDNAKFLGGVVATLALAKAAGADVNTDKDDADFLKIKVGNTRYDMLTGLQQPLRFMLRMSDAIRGGDAYSGDTKGKILGDFARSKSAPLAGYGWDFIEGKNRLSGKKFDAATGAKDMLLPLPYQDFRDAAKEDGKLKGLIEALPTLLGVGVQTYKGSTEKATTPAEKLARRMIIRKMPDEARDQEEMDQDAKLAELRVRARKGEDVSKELQPLFESGAITKKRGESILNAEDSRFHEDVNRLSLKDVLTVYDVATPKERQDLFPLLLRKRHLLYEMDGADRKSTEERLKKIGMPLVGPIPPKEARVKKHLIQRIQPVVQSAP